MFPNISRTLRFVGTLTNLAQRILIIIYEIYVETLAYIAESELIGQSFGACLAVNCVI